ncbi:MAG: hypothetical protein L0215_05560 [Gemmataceae bacterium]|nr:hypothetical protein [Gemmataceae bacterium]
MQEQSPKSISASEHQARLERAETIARRLGFVGRVEYRHAYSRFGGAQYGMAATIEQDVLVVDAEAFRRDATGDDFSLEAIIAHERGHQLLCRHERLRRNLPRGMSTVTEEVLASLVGSLIAENPRDGQILILKALSELVESGMPLGEASQRVEDVLTYLEAVL